VLARKARPRFPTLVTARPPSPAPSLFWRERIPFVTAKTRSFSPSLLPPPRLTIPFRRGRPYPSTRGRSHHAGPSNPCRRAPQRRHIPPPRGAASPQWRRRRFCQGPPPPPHRPTRRRLPRHLPQVRLTRETRICRQHASGGCVVSGGGGGRGP
jgi:hypothetical protein